jgi:ubiquinone/menaquinone biosynthesis C-methylase UbiE
VNDEAIVNSRVQVEKVTDDRLPRREHRQIVSSGLSNESLQTEEARIRAAYARRHGDEVLYSWFSPGNLFMAQERERQMLTLLKRHGFGTLKTTEILEVGCGDGYWLREFIKWGARPENIIGIDLLPGLVAEAKRLCPSAVQIRCDSAAKLAFPDAAFDLVLQSTVFTSILDSDMKQRVASEMIRVVKKDGLIVWYDYHVNNPWNPDVRGVKRREIDRLFPGCRIKLQRTTLAPPLVRLLAPYSWMVSYLLAKCPFLCTHYLGLIQKI